MSAGTPVTKKLTVKPIVISNNQKMVIKGQKLLSNFKMPKIIQQYKDEVIYSSPKCDFLKGDSQEVLIVNRLNLLSKTCRTIARCTVNGVITETTSDGVSSVIGQKNYETVLSALSSVFNEETKIRGILSLLTTPKKSRVSTTAAQTDLMKPTKLADNSCQTVDTRINKYAKDKQRKRIRRNPLVPYVVTKPNEVKKYVINIDKVKYKYSNPRKVKEEDTPKLPDLKSIQFDDESNMSDSSVGNISLSGLSNISDSIVSDTNKFFKEIDKVTDKTLNSTYIPLRDGSKIMVPRKPEDIFHIAAPDILKNVTHEERMKLLWHQAFIDFKMCLEQDEDGYYPLHIAVLNNDVDLVRRQCASLRSRRESVDLPAGGLTALHMAIRQNVSVDCTRLLLQNGADPLLCDQERRCSFHMAAEAAPQLRVLVNYCDTNARSVLKNNQDFWRPEYESKSDAELKDYLYECVSNMFDEQGYTPLMAAAEASLPSSVAQLCARAAHVDAAAPHCGATALYRAVTKACMHAAATGNKTIAPDVLKTIEILVEHGADPAAENHSGSSVNTLLTEFNISALSMTIANKMTALKHGQPKDSLMLYKQDDGKIRWLNGKPDNVSVSPNLHDAMKDEKPDTTDLGEADDKNSINLKETELKVNEAIGSKDISMISSSVDGMFENKGATEDDKCSIAKSLNASKISNNEDIKMRRVKLGNVILNAKNLKINIKEENLTRSDNNRTQLNDPRIANVSKANINVTSTPTYKILVNNIDDDRKFRVAASKQIKIAIKDGHIITNPTVPESKVSKKSNKRPRVNAEVRSAKNRKVDTVVIVEDVAIKKGFSVPNILRVGTGKVAKPRDIVISKNTDLSPEIVIAKDTQTHKSQDK